MTQKITERSALIIRALMISAQQCHPTGAIITTYQCNIIRASLSMPISAAYQCPSVQPIRAPSSVPISAVYQCCLSVPPHQCALVRPIN
ncbi:unnamed protein product, partial [Staurois parvus]